MYNYNQSLIYFLTKLRKVQTIEIDTSKLVEALESIYSHSRTLRNDRLLTQVFVTDLSTIPRYIDYYNEQVVKFKAALERKLTLMQAIDRKIRDGFNELSGMINANKALSVLSSQERDQLHQLIGGTKALETQLRRARRRKR